MKRIVLVLAIGLLLVAGLETARANFNTSFSDAAGDTLDGGSPPQGIIDAADIVLGTSLQTGGNLTLTLTSVGTMLPFGSISTYILSTHGDLASVAVTLNESGGCALTCFWSYDYTGSGGGADFDFNVDYTVSGNTLTVLVPLAWGGDEATYSLTFNSTVAVASGTASSFDDGGHSNGAPVITNPTASTVDLESGESFFHDFDAVDPEGDAFTWTASTSPTAPWLTMDPDNGVLQGTPPAAGSWTVLVTVRDTFGSSSSHILTIRIVSCTGNRAPTIINAPTATVHIDAFEPYDYDFNAGDPDGDTLSWDVSGAFGATIDDDGKLSYVPLSTGETTLTITVTDGCGNSDMATLTLDTADPITPPATTIFGGLLLFALLILIIVVVVVVLVIYFAVRRKPGQPPTGYAPQPGMPQQAPQYPPQQYPPYQPPGPGGPQQPPPGQPPGG